MFAFAHVLFSVFVLSHHNVECAKILGVFNVPSVSHQMVFQAIWKELSLRGHNVTIMSPNPIKDPSLVNLTEIDLSYLYRNVDRFRQQMSQSMDQWSISRMISAYLESVVEDLFQSEEVISVVKNNDTKFDLVLIEAVTPALYAFAAKFQCPLIGVASLDVQIPGHDAAGTPNHPVLYPDLLSTFTENFTFMEKVEAVIFYYWQMYLYYRVTYPMENRLAKEYFGENTPDVEELAKNMSILFLNTNPLLHGARPYGPNVIQMGRMHLKPKRPLPTVSTKPILYNKTQTCYSRT